jgi:signal transduction histidine kinase
MAVNLPVVPRRVGLVPGAAAGDRELHARLLAAQEAERARISRELHDVVGQALTAVRLSLVTLDRVHARTGASGAEILHSIETVDAALTQVRTVAFEIRPPVLDDLGLAAALRTSCRRTASRAGVALRFRADVGEERFAREVETACFRVAQEAITNVVRHAGASRLTVRLAVRRRAGLLVLDVRDDGVGFDPAELAGSRRLGIVGMQERASLAGGSVEVWSRPGAGTRVSAWFAIDGPSGPSSPPPADGRRAAAAGR